MTRNLCALVMAAGLGSRYRASAGPTHNKLCAPCIGRDGVERPVLGHVLTNLQPHVQRTLVITRASYKDVIAMATAVGCEPVIIESAGLGDSIAAGIVHAGNAGGWLLTLGDMPFILPSTFQQVADSLQPGRISVPMHEGRYGHPVGFAGDLTQELALLSGERGARRLFRQDRVFEIPVNDPGALWDVDVPESLRFTSG